MVVQQIDPARWIDAMSAVAVRGREEEDGGDDDEDGGGGGEISPLSIAVADATTSTTSSYQYLDVRLCQRSSSVYVVGGGHGPSNASSSCSCMHEVP